MQPRHTGASSVTQQSRRHARTKFRCQLHISSHKVGVDVVEVKDVKERVRDILDILDYGAAFEQASIVREAGTNGKPSLQRCLEAFVYGWVRPLGWPEYIAEASITKCIWDDTSEGGCTLRASRFAETQGRRDHPSRETPSRA